MAERLQVATYNIQHGSRLDLLGQTLNTMREDGVSLFCLQEVWEEQIGEGLRNRLPEGWKGAYYPAELNDTGVALLWNSQELEMLKLDRGPLPYLEKRHILERRFSSFRQALHRGVITGIFKFGDRNFRATSVHLDWQGGMNHRLRQIKHIKEFLASLDPIDHEVIAGDFNTVLFSGNTRAKRESIRSTLGNEFEEILPAVLSTYNMQSLHYSRDRTLFIKRILLKLGISIPQRLDYIFIKGFKLHKAQVEKLDGSDHFPITAELSFS